MRFRWQKVATNFSGPIVTVKTSTSTNYRALFEDFVVLTDGRQRFSIEAGKGSLKGGHNF